MTSMHTTIVVCALLQAAAEDRLAHPTVADPRAVELLNAFQSRLYDPVAEGLESLEFDVVLSPLGITLMQSVAFARVRWRQDAWASALCQRA